MSDDTNDIQDHPPSVSAEGASAAAVNRPDIEGERVASTGVALPSLEVFDRLARLRQEQALLEEVVGDATGAQALLRWQGAQEGYIAWEERHRLARERRALAESDRPALLLQWAEYLSTFRKDRWLWEWPELLAPFGRGRPAGKHLRRYEALARVVAIMRNRPVFGDDEIRLPMRKELIDLFGKDAKGKPTALATGDQVSALDKRGRELEGIEKHRQRWMNDSEAPRVEVLLEADVL